MIDVDYPKLLDLCSEHLDPERTESASFLIWYLENYYRLDPLEAVDAVCDQTGDKGIDGIFVNDNDQTITIFQSKISQRSDKTIGDAALRTFSGSLNQLSTHQSLSNLLATAGDTQLAALIKRHDLLNKIETYELQAEFVSNIDIDKNGEDFLKATPAITFVGKSRLIDSYISTARDQPARTPITFDILGFLATEYVVDANTKAVIAPVKATELVAMEGISDQSLFNYNVRGPLGHTKVNRDIVGSIKDPTTHKIFPLFHNGITVISKQVDVDSKGGALTIEDYHVVNGCQSLSSLFANKASLTGDLRVLVKFIKLNPASPEAGMITTFSNNQNGVRSRDFKANTHPQVRLQNEFKKHYAGSYAFEIKRGEEVGAGELITNEEAGLYLMAFDLGEPWATHRKYMVFEDRHAEIFGRPEVTADRIVLCQVIIEAIRDHLQKLDNRLFARYVLTKYMLLYAIRQILNKDEMSAEILKHPGKFVRNPKDRDRFRIAIGTLVDDLIIDLNGEVRDVGDDFDYRDKLRDATWVKKICATIVGDYLKLLARGRIGSFKSEWQKAKVQAR